MQTGRQVDLDSILKMVDDYNDNVIKDIVTLRSMIIQLAYGKVYECLNCGKHLYFNDKDKYYAHVDTDLMCCNLPVYTTYSTNIGIPSPYCPIAIPKPFDRCNK